MTNCREDLLTRKGAVVLYRTRWQIELMYKLWNSHDHLAAGCELWTSLGRMAMFWAKLIGVVLRHGLLLTSTWAGPRRSPWKAARVLRDWVVVLTGALEDNDNLIRTLGDLAVTIGAIAKKNRQSKRPGSFQLLLNPEFLDWNT